MNLCFCIFRKFGLQYMKRIQLTWRNYNPLRIGIKGLWFVNRQSTHKPKICKTSIFHEKLFLKYYKFKIISAGDIFLHICLELNDEREKFCRLFWLVLNNFVIYIDVKSYKNNACTDFVNVNIDLNLHSY